MLVLDPSSLATVQWNSSSRTLTARECSNVQMNDAAPTTHPAEHLERLEALSQTTVSRPCQYGTVPLNGQSAFQKPEQSSFERPLSVPGQFKATTGVLPAIQSDAHHVLAMFMWTPGLSHNDGSFCVCSAEHCYQVSASRASFKATLLPKKALVCAVQRNTASPAAYPAEHR